MIRFFLAAILTLCVSTHAALITWSPTQNTQSKADLIEGVPVYAYNGGPNGTTTIEQAGVNSNFTYSFTGTNFTDWDFVGTGADDGETPSNGITANVYMGGITSTGDTNFDNVIESFTYAGSGIVTGTLTLDGLNTNDDYLIQLFFNDQRNTPNSNRIMAFGDGRGNTADIGASATPGPQNDDYGQFAVGAFTATNSTQEITFAANGFGNVHINALLLVSTNVAPPVAPTNLTVTPGSGKLELDWDPATFAGLKHYNVLRSESSGSGFIKIGQATTPAYTDFGVNTGTVYYYTVTAENIAGDISAPSNEAFGTPDVAIVRPNFVFIITDDQDIYSVGAYRRSEPTELSANGLPYTIDTPNIDRLAAEGMIFHQARIMGADSGAVCTPSRTMVMTGKNTWEREVGVSAATTLPGVFNRNDYATYRTCKNGNSYPTANNEFTTVNDGNKRGNTDGDGSEWHGDQVVSYIDTWDSGGRQEPFLIYYGFSHPHDTRNARPELTNRYGCVNTDMPETVVFNPNAPPLPINALLGEAANHPIHPFDNGHLLVRDEISAEGVEKHRTEAVIRNEIGRNFACVDYIDQQVGRVLARLEDPNGDGNTDDSVMDNTYIVFTSDHGIAIGRHGLQGKQNLYEHTWRVPYIVRGPGIAAGSKSDALIYLHDTFPTFCDLAGITPPPTIDANDGQSIRPILEGTSTGLRDYVYGLYAGGSKPGMRAVTDGRWKIIKYDVTGNSSQVTQLFDLRENPFELLPEHGVPNLAYHPAYTLIRQELEEQLMHMRKEFADPYPFLGDRLLFRFEEGTNGASANVIEDFLPWQDNGQAMSGIGGLPTYSDDVFSTNDCVVGYTNSLSLDFEQDQQTYIEVPDSRELDFENEPFTIEAWVKFESMPNGMNPASTRPLAMKKVIGLGDNVLNYMFLASAGIYGTTDNATHLAFHFGGTTVIRSSLAVPDTAWHHISVAFDPVANAVRFTMDDQVDLKSTTVNGTANDGPLVIGLHFNSSGTIDYAFDGLIDEFSVSSGYLALEELQPLQLTKNAVTAPIIGTTSPLTENLIQFSSDPTRLYDLQSTPALTPPNWQTVESFIGGTLNSNQTQIRFDPDTGGRNMYRIRATFPRRPN